MKKKTQKEQLVFNVALFCGDGKLRVMRIGSKAAEFNTLKEAIACAKVVLTCDDVGYGSRAIVGEWIGRRAMSPYVDVYPSGKVYRNGLVKGVK